ncbi:MAG TPA: flagellar basal-body MS-ring/collar protein FliF [Dyella sp.]|uniref:flagellar basal-body MS-ring/collar protein FliF n=1 Tax=Dyella sp. TaxID=1869338 RepID=UPI002C38668C|nr:flagellar basal-body MS-ring/collar protein FliF [Dyella sp.]HUB90320.1 flagellar basal-body MS-ring/collar protein FliF [Dyella sp.]
MRQFFASMSQRARVAFVIGIVLIVGIVGVASWWIMHPPYAVLFRDLRETDAAEISSALDQMQVPYRLADEGKTILVPDAQVYETRMKLVSQGVPKGGSVGFELFKDSDYGVTEFAQRVNFQRALQGELERTISALDEVASARVHLTIRRSDLFSPDQDPSKASVTLTMRPAKHLDAREVAGIQRLVASAVEGLSPDAVVVLDDKGMVLSGYSAEGQNGALNSSNLDAQSQMESQLRARVGELLHRVLRTDNFTVSVNVSLNYDHVKQVREQLIGQGKDGNGLLVREKINSTGHAGDSADIDHANGSTSSDREVEYAHGREQEEVDQAPGRVGRISVGIVIPATLPSSEISKLSEVVSAGLGLDPTRGDKVDIAAIAPPEPVAVSAPTALDNTVAVRADATAATTAPSTDEAASSVAASRYWWIYPVIAALVLFLVGALLMAMRTSTPRRLTMSEREAALLRLRQWIETPEVER